MLLRSCTLIMEQHYFAADDVHCIFGEWRMSRNAGGKIDTAMSAINPQYSFEIRGICVSI